MPNITLSFWVLIAEAAHLGERQVVMGEYNCGDATLAHTFFCEITLSG